MKNATKKQWMTGALALTLAAAATATGARAQMGGDGPPPPPPPFGAPPADGNGGDPNRPRGNRSPEQQQAQRAQMLKRMLENTGVIDVKSQDAVVAFAATREEATRELQEKSRAVMAAVRNGATTDAEIAAVLDDFRAAVAAERTRRARAETELDTTIGWSKKPRLDALLTTMGLIGDEAAITGGGGRGMGGGRGAGGPGGMGGRGGNGPGGGRRSGPGGGGPDDG